MVLTESIKNQENSQSQEKAMSENEKTDASEKIQAPAQKLFSCEELERSISSQLTGNGMSK